MSDLKEILNSNIIITKRRIHDCQATISPETLVQSSRTLVTNDCATYEYNNDSGILWDKDNSIIKDTVLDSLLLVTIAGSLISSANNNRLKIEIEIDSTIPTQTKTKIIEVVRTDEVFEDYTFQLYNGTLAKQYGFKIYLTALDADITLNKKTILITQ